MVVPPASQVGSLPLFRTHLIGREAELATARSFLLDAAVPLLTLTGPGGVGKTRLALAVAQEVVEHFADGVTFIDLSPLTAPQLVPTSAAAALGVTLNPERAVTEDIVAVLHRAQRLLVLDNCEHLLAAAAELVATLIAACPAVQILATSRAPLHVRCEQELPVDPLSVPGGDELPAGNDWPARGHPAFCRAHARGAPDLPARSGQWCGGHRPLPAARWVATRH